MIIFDADNTLRVTKSGAKFINDPDDQMPIPFTQELVSNYAIAHKIYIATNQGGVAAGHKSLESAIKEQRITLEMFPEIEAACMAHDYKSPEFWMVWRDRAELLTATCEARKPSPGMLLYLVSLAEQAEPVVMIGDSADDAGAVDAANLYLGKEGKRRIEFLHIDALTIRF